MTERMETSLPSGLRFVRMPDGTLSELIAWMHRKIEQHKANSVRWYHRNVTATPDPAKAAAPKRDCITPEEKRLKAAAYMRTYRKKLKARREKMLKDIDSGALERRIALTKWKNSMRWHRRNRKRMLRAGIWRGYPKKPECLTKPAKPTA